MVTILVKSIDILNYQINNANSTGICYVETILTKLLMTNLNPTNVKLQLSVKFAIL